MKKNYSFYMEDSDNLLDSNDWMISADGFSNSAQDLSDDPEVEEFRRYSDMLTEYILLLDEINKKGYPFLNGYRSHMLAFNELKKT